MGVTITISNNEDVSTLIAEKLYRVMKDDLINSGTGVISEVCIRGRTNSSPIRIFDSIRPIFLMVRIDS